MDATNLHGNWSRAADDTPYHIWLRLRATAQSNYYDSVFVQFSDAITAQGGAAYRMGTTSDAPCGVAVQRRGLSTVS